MPIFWSFQMFNVGIGENALADPLPVLGVSEKEIYKKFKFDKRRGDWLEARLLAKDLIRRVDERWKNKEQREIEILNLKSGAPVLVVTGSLAYSGKVSLSHSNGGALCAYSQDDIQFGVDLELVEPRSKEFVEDFFTATELEQIAQQPVAEKDLSVTVIWSAKESVLKALSSGLRVDTRSIEVTLITCSDAWNKLELKSTLVNDNSLRLVWRREGKFVITACIPPDYTEKLIQVEV